MSKRPSKKNCTTSTSSTNTYGYAIIGDTVAGTLYAKRLIGNKVTTPISLINEGVSRTNLDNISDTSFVVENNKTSLQSLHPEKVHMVGYGGSENHDDASTQQEQIIQLYTPSGPLGDFIAAYHLPRLGPWFTNSTDTRAEKFFTQNTIRTPLNSQEVTVSNYIANLWHLSSTASFIVKTPSILNCHHTFIINFNNTTERELFLDYYQLMGQESNVDYITEASNIKFTQGTGTSYNVDGSDFSLTEVRPIWKTNLYTYLRLATEGGLHPSPVNIPVFYRAILPISINAGRVDLTGLPDEGDLVTTHISFSLYDIHSNKSSNLVWLIQCYTAVEDLSVVEPSGRYADSGKTLLIIEAICTKNRRQASYNLAEKEIQVKYNDKSVESGYMRQFAEISSNIYTAYTAQTISVDELVTDSSTCGPEGTCHDGNIVVDFPQRQSPLLTVIETVGQLYGTDLYPVVSKC